MLLNRSLRLRLAAALEWSAVDKSLILIALLIPLYFQYILWSLYVLNRADRDMLIHVDVVHKFMAVEAWLILTGIGIALIGLMLRRRWPNLQLFQYVALQFYALSLVLMSYSIGTLSFCSGVVLLGGPVFGFILHDRLPVWLAFITALIAIVGLSYASVFGYMPYAPVRMASSDPVSELFWMNSTLFFAAPFLIFLTLMADQMLAWWRVREERIHQLSRTDALTNLHNRRSILDLLEQELTRVQRKPAPLSVVILDLDHFKKVNDTWGHPMGDRVLQVAARVLRESVREGDHVGRYGGEEFMLILPDTRLADAMIVLERCRQQLVAADVVTDSQDRLQITASFGLVCQDRTPLLASQQLIQHADEALYAAKANGRNRIEVQALSA
ncbi:MAG: GGDEF domain-containing protein [Pseudomonadota bacterium]